MRYPDDRRGSLRERSYCSLLEGARLAAPNVYYDSSGYASGWTDNLRPGLPMAEITLDFGAGAGRELDYKLRAAHSSAALAINCFGRWRIDPASLCIAGVTGFRSLRFEATAPTGLGGTPPHLDLLADGDSPVAVESKCTEWMETKPAAFSASYDRLAALHGNSPWFAQIRELRRVPESYKYLDAAQLVKHALGLLTHNGRSPVRLVYLYWEPSNADDWPQCRLHREEAEHFVRQVNSSHVRLVPMAYSALWREWDCATQADPSIRALLAYLRARYEHAA